MIKYLLGIIFLLYTTYVSAQEKEVYYMELAEEDDLQFIDTCINRNYKLGEHSINIECRDGSQKRSFYLFNNRDTFQVFPSDSFNNTIYSAVYYKEENWVFLLTE